LFVLLKINSEEGGSISEIRLFGWGFEINEALGHIKVRKRL